jgi:putative ABC transport system permease protein
MNFTESFKQALDSLKSNKLRSILTMLGIIMGVFSIITIVEIGTAAESYMNSQFEKIGANTISIMYKSNTVSESEWLRLDDMDTIVKVAPEIKNIATAVQKSGTVRAEKDEKNAIVYGVSSQYRSFDLIEMYDGRFINDFDVSAKSKVAIIDENYMRKHFNSENVIGEIISLRTPSGTNYNLKVIGVISRGEDFFSDMLDDDLVPAMIYLPISTVQSMYPGGERLDNIYLSLVDSDKLQDVGKRVVEALEAKKGQEDIYMAFNSAEIQAAINDVLNVVSSVLLAIAIITLIVGGIGIVNILLVSVTERIREIGTRKALGAQKKDIVIQFITESVIMTATSGIVGIILGIIAGGIISSLIKIPPVIDWKVIVSSFLGSVLLGLIFGVYPAKRAADLDPIEALRYE